MHLVSFLWDAVRPRRRYLFGLIGMAAVISLCFAGFPVLIRAFVLRLERSEPFSLLAFGLAFAGLHVLFGLAWRLNNEFSGRVFPQTQQAVLDQIYQKSSKQSAVFFQGKDQGALLTQAAFLFNGASEFFETVFGEMLRQALFFLAVFCIFFWVHPACALLFLLFGALFALVGRWKFPKCLEKLEKASEIQAELFGKFNDVLRNILVVRSFGAQLYEQNRLKGIGGTFADAGQKAIVGLGRFYHLQSTCLSLYEILLFWFLFFLYSRGKISMGDVFLVCSLNSHLVESIFSFAEKTRTLAPHLVKMSQALKVLGTASEISDMENALDLRVEGGEILFDRISFSHNQTVLFQDFSLHIAPNTKVGLVGLSGGGKTTLTHLLMRFFDPESGAVLIDGQNVRDVTQESLHKAVGWVPQDAFLLNQSVLENIRYGRLESSDEETIEAAKRAHVDSFVAEGQEGYEKIVGENGNCLSGGQRQRLAIARLVLKNPKIVVLDEASSQLDSMTEQALNDELLAFMEGKTVLAIAHRLSTLAHMDRILVLEHGRMVEDGSHEELLLKNGAYKRLIDAQVHGLLPETL